MKDRLLSVIGDMLATTVEAAVGVPGCSRARVMPRASVHAQGVVGGVAGKVQQLQALGS